MKKSPKIYFRADGDAKIGLGHVIRSLAFAEMIKEHFECHFIIRNPSAPLIAQIKKVCTHLIQLQETMTVDQEAEFLTQNWFDNQSIVVLDGYPFETSYQKIIKSAGCKLISIDDINQYHFLSDAVINHSGGFTSKEYSVEPYTTLLLGPSYALLRPEFQLAAKNKKQKSDSSSVFICLGGADPKNDTLHVLQECIRHKPDFTYFIVLGSAFQHLDAIRKLSDETATDIHISQGLNAQEMADLMQKCPIAITSPSTVSYEYLSTGGQLFLKVIADNQLRINEFLISNKLAFDFDDFSKVEPSSYDTKLQNSLFDGNQKKRLLKLLFNLVVDIEIATEKDVKLYFDWANDPQTRSQSFQSKPILWEEHTRWFANKLESGKSIFYKARILETNIGQIRYDLNQNEALINYSVDTNYRGLGIGAILIEKTLQLIGSYFKNDYSVIGYVKHDNIASSKVFRKLGFKEFESDEYQNTYKYIFECKR